VPSKQTLEEEWYQELTYGENVPRNYRRLMGLLPSSPRCKLCNAPFKGWGGFIMHLLGKEQSRFNPRYCQACARFEKSGGAEVVLTMLFADMRGSTNLASKMSAREFSDLINRFYIVATDILIKGMRWLACSFRVSPGRSIQAGQSRLPKKFFARQATPIRKAPGFPWGSESIQVLPM
jgi:hypothetical protein